MRRRVPHRPGGGRAALGPRSPIGGVRELAGFVVERTLQSHAPVDTFLEPALARCDVRDHGLLHELVLGTLRHKRRLEHLVSQAAERPLEQIEARLHAPLLVAAYQLFFLDRVPDHAVVNEAVELAHRATHRGGASMVNAVLRRLARERRLDQWPVEHDDPVTRLAIEYSHPDFLVRRWLERFGRVRTRLLLEVNNRGKGLHLLAFRDRGGRELLAEELIDQAVEVVPSLLAPQGLRVLHGEPLGSPAFAAGACYVQDEASQIAALLPPPRPGERILDLAAAPGGKSFALLSLEPAARVVAADVSLDRLRRLRQNLRRLKRTLPLLVADARRPAARALFDRVVVDLPCSGTGTLRRHPELRWRVSEAEIERLARGALQMLRGASTAVAPGGLLVAITCSLEAEENEQVIARLREEHPELSPVDLAAHAPPAARDTETAPGMWRLFTADDHDGFTVHALEKAH